MSRSFCVRVVILLSSKSWLSSIDCRLEKDHISVSETGSISKAAWRVTYYHLPSGEHGYICSLFTVPDIFCFIFIPKTRPVELESNFLSLFLSVFTGTWVWRGVDWVSCCTQDGWTNMESPDGSSGCVNSELFLCCKAQKKDERA